MKEAPVFIMAEQCGGCLICGACGICAVIGGVAFINGVDAIFATIYLK